MSGSLTSITHPLRVKMGPNKVSIELAAGGKASRTSWEFKLVETRSVSNSQRNGITHRLRVQFGGNEVSIKFAGHGMALRTSWEFKFVETKSVSNLQHMEWHYAPAENSIWLKRGQYWIRRTLNGITHWLRIQIGGNEVSIEFAAHGWALRTTW